ncbi:uncharacterized protein METZ01_LOCUS322550, partial [marine metagenome]
MKAVRIHEHGEMEKLIIDDIPEPECPPDKAKIKVIASALNHLDIWVRKGLPTMPITLPLIMGSDGSGVIVEVGSQIENWKKDDDIVIQPGNFCGKCSHCKKGNENYCNHFGILGETENGIQAEYIIVDPINIHKKPDHLTYVESASMQLVFLTAYQMLVKRAELQPEETVLV